MAVKMWRGLDKRTGSADLPDEASPDTSNTAPVNGRVDLLGPRPGKLAVTPQGYAGGIAGIIPFQLPGATHILVPQFDGTVEDSTISSDGASSIFPTGEAGDLGATPFSYSTTITYPTTTATQNFPLSQTYSTAGTRISALLYMVTTDTSLIAPAAAPWSILLEQGMTLDGATTYPASATLSISHVGTTTATSNCMYDGSVFSSIDDGNYRRGYSAFYGGGGSLTAGSVRVTVTWPTGANGTCTVTINVAAAV